MKTVARGRILYLWGHKDGRICEGSAAEMGQWFGSGAHPAAGFYHTMRGTKSKLSAYGWSPIRRLPDRPIKDRKSYYIPRRKPQLPREWFHLNGTRVFCTQNELIERHSLRRPSICALLNGSQKIAHGWSLQKYTPPEPRSTAPFRRRLLISLRSRIAHAIYGRGYSQNTRELTGCSRDEFFAHIASRFKPGMTFENYGQWHIDHIRPCAAFDLTNEDEAKKCFHFSNLQPLWAAENWIKSDRMPES